MLVRLYYQIFLSALLMALIIVNVYAFFGVQKKPNGRDHILGEYKFVVNTETQMNRSLEEGAKLTLNELQGGLAPIENANIGAVRSNLNSERVGLCASKPELCAYGQEVKAILNARNKFEGPQSPVENVLKIFVDQSVLDMWGGPQHWLTSSAVKECAGSCAITSEYENAGVYIHNLHNPPNARMDKFHAMVNFEAYGYSHNSDTNTILVSYHQESDLLATYAYSVMHAFSLCVGDPEGLTISGKPCENMEKKESPFYRWCAVNFGGDFYTCVFNVVPHVVKQNAVNKSTDALAVAWISNRCDRHQGYLAELMKHIKIDSMGNCQKNKDEMQHIAWQHRDDDGIWWGKNMPPPIQGNGNRKMLLASHYKFFISIENTILEDYVTEKFYEGLLTDSVMVYLGAPNINRYAPSPLSFVNALDFDGPVALATFLNGLATDEGRYNSFTQWKRERPIKISFGFEEAMKNDIFRLDNKSMLCRLCNMIKQ